MARRRRLQRRRRVRSCRAPRGPRSTEAARPATRSSTPSRPPRSRPARHCPRPCPRFQRRCLRPRHRSARRVAGRRLGRRSRRLGRRSARRSRRLGRRLGRRSRRPVSAVSSISVGKTVSSTGSSLEDGLVDWVVARQSGLVADLAARELVEGFLGRRLGVGRHGHRQEGQLDGLEPTPVVVQYTGSDRGVAQPGSAHRSGR